VDKATRQHLEATQQDLHLIDHYLAFQSLQGQLHSLDPEAHETLMRLCDAVKHLHAAVQILANQQRRGD
jgi:hypothetical protein